MIIIENYKNIIIYCFLVSTLFCRNVASWQNCVDDIVSGRSKHHDSFHLFLNLVAIATKAWKDTKIKGFNIIALFDITQGYPPLPPLIASQRGWEQNLKDSGNKDENWIFQPFCYFFP